MNNKRGSVFMVASLLTKLLTIGFYTIQHSGKQAVVG